MTIQCMGGWCLSRAKCANYWAPPLAGRTPVERLCGRKEEPEPIKQQKQLERAEHERQAV